jgi:hypothetical protein
MDSIFKKTLSRISYKYIHMMEVLCPYLQGKKRKEVISDLKFLL